MKGRIFSALLVTGAALLALYHWVWLPFHCNVAIGRGKRALDAALSSLDDYQAHVVGLRNVANLQDFFTSYPDNLDLILLMGRSLEAAGRHASAREIYCGGLVHNRSSGELYLACARTQLLTGDRAGAEANFVLLGKFAGPSILREIPDPTIRGSVMANIGDRHKRLLKLEELQLVANGAFAATAATTRGRQRPGLRPSAAAEWYLLNKGAEKTTTTLAGAGGGDEGLVVETTARGGGIQQLLPRRTSERVIVTATVFVTRGRACLGASNGVDFVTTSCSQNTGKWETIQSVSESCPVRQVAIRASTPGGAQFTVAKVEAYVTHAFPPCGR